MAADKDDFTEVRIQMKIDGEVPETNEQGVALVRGRPINELLKSDPEFFAQVQDAFGKALAEALGVDPDSEPQVDHTRTRDVDWDKLKTFGPEDLLEPGAGTKADKDSGEK